MLEGTLLTKVLSNPQLLLSGGKKGFRKILELGPSPNDYEREKTTQEFYRNVFEIIANFLYKDFLSVTMNFLQETIGERANLIKRELYYPPGNEQLLVPEELLVYCGRPLYKLILVLYDISPAKTFCLLVHTMKLNSTILSSQYDITEYELAMDAEFIDVCVLLLMGNCIFNERDRKWYKYDGKLWKETKISAIASYLLRQFHTFINDLCSTLSKKTQNLEGDARKEMESLIGHYKGFCIKKNYSKLKAILEPLEEILKTTQEISTLNSEEHYLWVENGLLDLRIGEVRPYNPTDFATFYVPVPYIKKAEITDSDEERRNGEKTFRYFIETFTSEKSELEDFLQLWFGYGITGLMSEQQFLVILGRGSNSKSIFAKLFKNTLGKYFSILPHCVVIESNKSSGQATPHLEKLAKIRLGVVIELKSKDKFDLQNLKNLTGGDDLPHRALYSSYEEIESKTKLFIITNEMAKATFSYSYARRVVIFPSTVRFVKGLKKENKTPGVYPVIYNFDKKMNDKFVSEAFLRFLVEGTKKLFEMSEKPDFSGIPLPEEVNSATENYLSSINDIGRYLLDITDNISREYTEETLFDNFKNWFYKYKGWDVKMGLTKFTTELEEMGVLPNEDNVYIIPGDPRKTKPRYNVGAEENNLIY